LSGRTLKNRPKDRKRQKKSKAARGRPEKTDPGQEGKKSRRKYGEKKNRKVIKEYEIDRLAVRVFNRKAAYPAKRRGGAPTGARIV